MNNILLDVRWFEAFLWLSFTLVVYVFSLKLYEVTKKFSLFNPLLHPLIVTPIIIIAVQLLTKTSVQDYQSHTAILTMLLGPATVALAVPLFKQLRILRRMSWRVLLPIVLAGILAPLLSWVSLYLLDTPINLQMTMLVKSITTPLAMDAASVIGGIPPLAAVFVISTGIVGAVCGPVVFTIIGVTNHAAQGTALGTVAHGIGTAKAISISEQCSAFASLALCVNGIFTALLLPILFG